MTAANQSYPKLDSGDRVQALVLLEMLARYLAKKEVRNRLRDMGKWRWESDPVEFNSAVNAYLQENRFRLREEARAILNRVG